MKITFFSNYFNHHQKSVCDAFCEKGISDFAFVETKPMRQERIRLGYSRAAAPAYVKDQTCGLESDFIDQRISSSDVVICGSAIEEVQKLCGKTKNLLFRYSERLLKKGLEPVKIIPRWIRLHRKNPMRKRIYLLCASAYAAGDYAKFGLFRNRAYQWGYFPATKRYDNPDAVFDRKDPFEILWCGRFLSWKHPEDALMVARMLKESGFCFTMKFIGGGELETVLNHMIECAGLSECVKLLGPMSPDEVRTHMEHAGIFLFTSDKQEGWGAVLNESMNSGCAVIASHEIGSVPFLIKDNENGSIYESGNVDMLYEKVKYLLEHKDEQRRLGAAAYHTIIEEWNAEVAVERFLNLAQHILDGEESPNLYETGPCSKALRLSDRWQAKEVSHKQ